ncbi:MAG: DUF3429 domain-containing protein [Pseudomonadota bacterium]
MRPPKPALYLGLAGLLPFLAAALGQLVPSVSDSAVSILGPRFGAAEVLVSYGSIILVFMSGVLWGFATKSSRYLAYLLSVLPALWVFFAVTGDSGQALSALITGFIFVFVCDLQFARWGLTPKWWIPLRAGLSAVVIACLLIGIWS